MKHVKASYYVVPFFRFGGAVSPNITNELIWRALLVSGRPEVESVRGEGEERGE